MREASRITYQTKNPTVFIFLWKDAFRVEWSYRPPRGLIFDLHCLKKEVYVVTFMFWDCIAVLIARGLAQQKAQKIYFLYHCDGFSSDSGCAQPSLKQRVPKLSLSH